MTHKILVVLTNHAAYPGGTEVTGLWLSELTHFYHILKEAGFEMDFVSPKGGSVPLDPRSLQFPFMDAETQRYHDDPAFMARLDETLAPEQVNARDYVAIYYTGGHGTMWDFADNAPLQAISSQVYENGGIVSAVCHGNAGLLNIKLSDGSHLIEGKRVTGFSNIEEVLALKRNQVPYLLEDEMKKRGAKYKKAILPLIPFKQVDGRLITGQNPSSARVVAEALVEQLKVRTSG